MTFHVVCLTWVFFRAESVGDALDILVGALRPTTGISLDASFFRWLPVLLVVEFLMWRTRITDRVLRAPLAYWVLVGLGLVFTLALGDFRGSDFVYFQF